MRLAVQERTLSQAQSVLQRALSAGQATDGGWPYYPGRVSRLEPTAWAVLALRASKPPQTTAAERGLAFLRERQQPSGLLVEAGSPGPNFAWNGLALLAGMSRGNSSTSSWQQRVATALLSVRGVALEQSNAQSGQNNRLQAWSWIESTFSWIEPTAVCLLALKKANADGPLARTRVADAEALILNRVCDEGGWNYGNAQVLGQDLRPYVPTTALALLAMQNRRDHPVVARSLAWLKTHAVSEPSTLALSLAALSLQVAGEPADEPTNRLLQRASETIAFSNLHAMALALYALTASEHGAAELTIG
jgi:hypothetical protein